MPKRLICSAYAALLCVAGGAAAPQIEFEAASVKPAGTQRTSGQILGHIIGGPGTPDPIQLRGDHVTLANLIRAAYDVPYDQISGPGWMQDSFYDIVARVPKGSTKDQLKLMLQNLLADRFRLTSIANRRSLMFTF